MAAGLSLYCSLQFAAACSAPDQVLYPKLGGFSDPIRQPKLQLPVNPRIVHHIHFTRKQP